MHNGDLKHAGDKSASASQLVGWVRAPSRCSTTADSQPLKNITIDMAGIYIIYSKITFGCSSSTSRSTDDVGSSIEHKINASDGNTGKSVHSLLLYASLFAAKSYSIVEQLNNNKEK